MSSSIQVMIEWEWRNM